MSLDPELNVATDWTARTGDVEALVKDEDAAIVSKADLRVVLHTEHPRPDHIDYYEALDRLTAAAK